jgi:CubicO group peptidase (beta-lactamase class C family)
MKHHLLSLILILLCLNAQSQLQKGELKMGEDMSFEIKPGGMHQVIVSLEQNQFVYIKLLQKGIDVQIDVKDPSGNKVGYFDSPNGTSGPEPIAFSTTSSGKYMLEISPFNEDGPSGTYDLNVISIQPKAIENGDQVDQLFTIWDSKVSPGAAVSVIQDGKIIYKNGYGMANLEYDISVEPSSVFHIASISKQFTAFSILLLESEGKLSLEDEIQKYIPEVPDFGKKITLRHLASHTSGMRDQWSLLQMAGWRMDDVITKEQVLKLVANQKELNFDPGEEYYYSNTGFTLLAEVVARVSGRTFAEFTQERIFEPLNMSNTLFYDDHEKIVKNRAYSYRGLGEGFRKANLNYANVGATSLFTTVEDLSLWSMNFWNMTVGNEEIFKKLNTPHKLNNGEEFEGALGQFVVKYKGMDEIQHGGADAGYRAYITRFPEENFAVIVFSNDGNFNPVNMAHGIVDIYLKDKLKEEKLPPRPPIPPTDTKEKSFDPSTVDLNEFQGEFYSEELQTTYKFKVVDGALMASHPRHPDFQLRPRIEDEFTPTAGFFGLTRYVRDDSNTITGIRVSNGRVRNLYFEKVK